MSTGRAATLFGGACFLGALAAAGATLGTVMACASGSCTTNREAWTFIDEGPGPSCSRCTLIRKRARRSAGLVPASRAPQHDARSNPLQASTILRIAASCASITGLLVEGKQVQHLSQLVWGCEDSTHDNLVAWTCQRESACSRLHRSVRCGCVCLPCAACTCSDANTETPD